MFELFTINKGNLITSTYVLCTEHVLRSLKKDETWIAAGHEHNRTKHSSYSCAKHNQCPLAQTMVHEAPSTTVLRVSVK